MTSASELFSGRRTRLGRVGAALESESAPDLTHRRRHLERRSGGHVHQSSRRQGLDGCIPLRRPSQWRMPGHGAAVMEGEPFEFNGGSSQYSPANNVAAEEGLSGPSSRSRVTCSERLPGAVLQARERLLQRLRGAAVSDRRSRRNSSNVSQISNILNDEFRLGAVGDWETDIFLRLSPRGSSSAGSVFHSELCKKPNGLTPEALNSLPIKIFSSADSSESADDDDLVSWDCSICLERFMVGTELVRLPCSHRFHLACLGQWGQIRGDCPCCRRSITS